MFNQSLNRGKSSATKPLEPLFDAFAKAPNDENTRAMLTLLRQLRRDGKVSVAVEESVIDEIETFNPGFDIDSVT